MCIRHELSLATSTSAPVSRTQAHLVRPHRHRNLGVLHRERPAEPAALLGRQELDQSDPADVAQQAGRASPTPSMRSEWQVGW